MMIVIRAIALTVTLTIVGMFDLRTAESAAQIKATTHTVVIEGMQFQPAALTVHRGDRIVWRNKDLVPHTTTVDGVFDSSTIPPEGAWTYIANKSGTLPYVCLFHPTMQGSLTIQ